MRTATRIPIRPARKRTNAAPEARQVRQGRRMMVSFLGVIINVLHVPVNRSGVNLKTSLQESNILSLAKASPLALAKASMSISTVRRFFSSPEMSRITRPSFIMISRLP